MAVIVLGNKVGKDMGQIAGSGANIKHTGSGMEKRKKGLARRSMHVWCRNSGTVANGLWGVFVGARLVGAIIRSIHLCLAISAIAFTMRIPQA